MGTAAVLGEGCDEHGAEREVVAAQPRIQADAPRHRLREPGVAAREPPVPARHAQCALGSVLSEGVPLIARLARDVDVDYSLECDGRRALRVNPDIRGELPDELQSLSSERRNRDHPAGVAEGAGAAEDDHLGRPIRWTPGRVVLNLLSEERTRRHGYLDGRVSALSSTVVRDDDARLGGKGANRLAAFGEGDGSIREGRVSGGAHRSVASLDVNTHDPTTLDGEVGRDLAP